MGRKQRLDESLLSVLSGLREGDGADPTDLNSWLLRWSGSEFHSRAIVGSTAKVGWLVDIRHDWYLEEGFLSELDSWLRRVTAVQTSLNDWLESGRPTLLYSFLQSCLQACWDVFQGEPLEEPSDEASIPSYAVVVSAVVLLSLVYQYLTGNVDRGGSKAYSRSSLDFRDVYVAIVLFLGAYVWIKFREVAPKGVYSRTVVHKHGGTRKVYEARLKPPFWNGKKLPRLDLGRFTTPQEARNKFLIAAFYYNRGAGLLDGWFQVPPMSEEERSLAGLEKRKWVISQAKKVYEDFKKEAEAKEKEEATSLLQDLLEVWDDQLLPEQDEVNVDFSLASFLNSVEQQQPTLEGQVENSGMGMSVLDNHGLECTSHSFDGMHEGFVLSNGHNLGFQEAYTLPISHLPPNLESGMSLNSNDLLESLQTLVCTQQQQISLQQQQIQGFAVQILELQSQQCIQQQQLQGFKLQSLQFCLQQQLLQDINHEVPSFEVEMEQSMHQQNYLGFMTPPPHGGEG